MPLSHFTVVHERGGAAAYVDDPLVHCFDGNQTVLAYVSRQALMDHFRVPGDRRITLAQWNLVVDSNLDVFKRIIEAKYMRGDQGTYEAHGQTYPKVVVTLEDMERSGEAFTMEVLNAQAGFRTTW
jgi:hypothetical protein